MRRLLAIALLLLLVGCVAQASPDGKKTPLPTAIALNFESPRQLSNLKIVSGKWSVSDGELHADGGLAVLENFAASNLTASVSFTAGEETVAGIVVRATNAKSYYLVAVADDGVISLARIVDGQRQPLAKTIYTLDGGMHTLTVDVNGPSIRAYADDETVIDYGEAEEKRGRVGLRAQGGMRFDDFSAEKI